MNEEQTKELLAGFDEFVKQKTPEYKQRGFVFDSNQAAILRKCLAGCAEIADEDLENSVEYHIESCDVDGVECLMIIMIVRTYYFCVASEDENALCLLNNALNVDIYNLQRDGSVNVEFSIMPCWFK